MKAFLIQETNEQDSGGRRGMRSPRALLAVAVPANSGSKPAFRVAGSFPNSHNAGYRLVEGTYGEEGEQAEEGRPEAQHLNACTPLEFVIAEATASGETQGPQIMACNV